MSDKLNMQIGERWQLVGNYGWCGLHGEVEIIGVTDARHAFYFDPSFVRNWFGEENEMYRELLEENPAMYVAEYVENELSGEFEKGQRLVFGQLFLDMEKTKRIEPEPIERKVTWCDDCEKELDMEKGGYVFLDRRYYSSDYSKIVCRDCFVKGNYIRLERGWHEHD
jgi:hypothetical protein